MHIQDFFAAVDKWHGILCSPVCSEGKQRLIWAYFGYGRDTKGSAGDGRPEYGGEAGDVLPEVVKNRL